MANIVSFGSFSVKNAADFTKNAKICPQPFQGEVLYPYIVSPDKAVFYSSNMYNNPAKGNDSNKSQRQPTQITQKDNHNKGWVMAFPALFIVASGAVIGGIIAGNKKKPIR